MDYDVIIIGAGVVGLAIAQELAEKSNKSVLVIEKEAAFGQGISSRNSEVIHSGIYYSADSLKAKLCTRGRDLLYDFCKKHAIWHNQCGKLVVGKKEQTQQIEALYQQGLKNHVPELKIIKKDEIQGMEPFIDGDLALFVGCTGILSAHELMTSLYTISMAKGHDYLFRSEVIKTAKVAGGYQLEITNPQSEKEMVSTEWVINAAGLHSDLVARLVSENNQLPQLRFSKGCYFSLSSKWRGRFNHLVYPVPDKAHESLGIHLSFNQTGMVKLGPSAHWLNGRVEDYAVDEALTDLFHQGASEYIKELHVEDLTPDFSGIRPKIFHRDQLMPDFYIRHETDLGLRGWINLIGIDSPGLTASLAIGEYVVRMMNF